MHVIRRRRAVQIKPRLFTNLSTCWIKDEEQGRQEVSLDCHLEDSVNQLEHSAAAYILVLRQCRNDVSLEGVKHVHANMIRSGFVQDRYLANSLVEAYGKCGSLENARAVFDRIHERNVFSWTVMIAAYAQNGHCWEAIHLFQQMNLEGVAPNSITLITVLGACSAEIDALKEGKTVHACAIDNGCDSNTVLGTALVNMYSKYGRLDDARRIFDKMPQCDVVAWTAMITAYAHQGHGNEALNLYHGMSLEGVKPNEITLVGIAEACGSFSTSVPQEEVHAHVVASGFESNNLVGNSLINMFSKCGDLHGARNAFDKILRKDVVSWIAVISAYTQHEFGKEALTLFKQMLLEGMIPNEATLISCLDACSCLENLAEGKTVHSVVAASGFESNPIVATALVSMYGNCGSLINARSIFGKMSRRDVVSWTAMIAAYEHQGLTKEVLELFRRMDLDGVKPNEVTFVTVLGACSDLTEAKVIHSSMAGCKFVSNVFLGTSLVSTYGKCGSMGDARSVFDAMPWRTAITWNALLTGYVSDRGTNEVFQLFQRMQLEGVKPNEVTFVSLLDACVNLGALAQGRLFHSRIVAEGFHSNVTVSNLLISMYGKCGSLDDASTVFHRMHLKNVISWTAVITSYAHHGHGKEALEFYQRMDLEGVKPDYVTFVSILFACSHAGMLDQGRHYFLAMVGDHGIDACREHYDCMVDLLGRAGRLGEVEDLITCMPFGGSAVAWMSLLGACKIHNDMERGERVGKRVSELEPENAGQYALLTNIYASAGRWEDDGSHSCIEFNNSES